MKNEKSVDFRIYLITDRKQTFKRGQMSNVKSQRDLLDVLEFALKGGVKAVQLREKDLSGKELFELAKEIRSLTKKYNAKLFINDRVDIAIAVEADGVHLGQNSFSPKDAKKLLGSKKLIGVSTHSLKEALNAEKDGADFITFGPVFYTPSKAEYGEPVGTLRLKDVVKAVSIPVFAIGGIKLKNIKEVMETGAYGAAVISEIIGAEKPKETTENLLLNLQG